MSRYDKDNKHSSLANKSSKNVEKSLVIIKPDAVRKKIVGEIISRIEREDLIIERLEMIKISGELACEHYCEHKGKDFFERLIEYITSDRVVVMIVSGEDAIQKVRALMGPTDPKKAERGTIRGDFGTDITVNVIHGSDSKESAEREIRLFFN